MLRLKLRTMLQAWFCFEWLLLAFCKPILRIGMLYLLLHVSYVVQLLNYFFKWTYSEPHLFFFHLCPFQFILNIFWFAFHFLSILYVFSFDFIADLLNFEVKCAFVVLKGMDLLGLKYNFLLEVKHMVFDCPVCSLFYHVLIFNLLLFV